MKTINDLKEEFEALVGKQVSLKLVSIPRLHFEGVLKRCEKEGYPYMIELKNGGKFFPSGKLSVEEISEVA